MSLEWEHSLSFAALVQQDGVVIVWAIIFTADIFALSKAACTCDNVAECLFSVISSNFVTVLLTLLWIFLSKFNYLK